MNDTPEPIGEHAPIRRPSPVTTVEQDDRRALLSLVARLIRRPLTTEERQARGITPAEYDANELGAIAPERSLSFDELEAILAAFENGVRSLSSLVAALRTTSPAIAQELARFILPDPDALRAFD